MSTWSISNLPPELLAQIVASVPTKFSLRNIALCSSQLYSVTVPILYTQVELYSDCSYEEDCLFCTRLHLLTDLFHRKPSIALYVRHFKLDHRKVDGFECDKHRNEVPIIDKSLKEALRAITISAEECEEWIDCLQRRRTTDSLLAILLPTMVKLERLNLALGPTTPYLDRMMMRAIARDKPFHMLPLFPTLTNFVHADSWEIRTPRAFFPRDMVHQMMGCRPVGSKYVKFFMALPSIRYIFGHGLSNIDEGREDDTAPLRLGYNSHALTLGSSSSSLTHLELMKSALNKDSLQSILEVPKALRTFAYELSTADAKPFDASFSDILLALAPQCNSLENLWLDYDNNISGHINRRIYDTIQSLSNFTHLKQLIIPAEAVISAFRVPFGDDFSPLFPETLEILHFNHVTINSSRELWTGLKGLLYSRLSQVPQLAKFIIECSTSMRKPKSWDEVREHAKTQGVDLIFLNIDRKASRRDCYPFEQD